MTTTTKKKQWKYRIWKSWLSFGSEQLFLFYQIQHLWNISLEERFPLLHTHTLQYCLFKKFVMKIMSELRQTEEQVQSILY